jgi:3-hydroxyisobutyrate dehydrogenase-like beta-hydroxyacid dehydrogenase
VDQRILGKGVGFDEEIIEPTAAGLKLRSVTVTPPTIGLIAQGMMGAGIGKRLSEHGLTVLTVLEGRSPSSIRRAEAAGMKGVTYDQVVDVDIFLSIVPPADALDLAVQLSPSLKAANRCMLILTRSARKPRKRSLARSVKPVANLLMAVSLAVLPARTEKAPSFT